MSKLISLENISRYYTNGDAVVKALDGASLEIEAGEFVAIVGQSGSGKSTLMNIIGCLDKPTSGTYKVLGVEASNLSSDELAALRRETFGFIFQRYNLLATSTAEENVEIPAVYAGFNKLTRISRARMLLAKLGLADRVHHRPTQLSGGQQQRVAIARALMNDPPVILADEPTGALDSKSGDDVITLLKQLNSEGKTIIVITHDESVARHAKRTIKLYDGKIIENGERQKDLPKIDAKSGLSGKNSSLRNDVIEAVKTALKALHVNIFRTSLTLLGVVIGVAAVITMLAVGQGSKEKVLAQISQMGTNLLNVRPGAPGVRSLGDKMSLTPDDAKAVSYLSNIAAVVPDRSESKTVRFGNIDYSTNIRGVGAAFPMARDWNAEKGLFFSEDDVRDYAAVAVLGSTVEGALFPDKASPLGKFILIGNIPFQVIGVMPSKGASPGGGDQDDVVYIPYTTGISRLFGSSGSTYINGITVKVDDVKLIDQTQADIEKLLLGRHGKEDFFVRNSASFIEMATATQNTLTILLGAVAAISLLVGGIGVMNIMLVSVVERTREIGVRMACGARMRDIMVQFNTESAVVCTIGGILGILTGITTCAILGALGVDVSVSLMPAALAFSCAVVTGILFGYLPAKKAAELDPVIALSWE